MVQVSWDLERRFAWREAGEAVIIQNETARMDEWGQTHKDCLTVSSRMFHVFVACQSESIRFYWHVRDYKHPYATPTTALPS